MKIIIIGNGIAGITCALAARQRERDAEITIISGETKYFFSRTALMYAYMNQMERRDLEPYERRAYKKQNIQLIQDWVVDLNATKKHIVLQNQKTPMAYDKLVFAVGAKPNIFPWKGIDQVKDGVVHFVSMQDLDACERLTPSTSQAVVVGGGLIGIELVECLLFHKIDVTFLIREPYYWPMALGQEEATFVTTHMKEHGVDVRLAEEMTQVNTDPDSGRVSSVETNLGNQLPCQMLGIAAGVRPNIDRIKQFGDAPKMGRGIIVNECLETSLPDVYAAGDCAEIHPSVGKPYSELIWYSAKRQGALVGQNLFEDKHIYTPPLFFNSSKFFELEYTTVGEIMKLPAGTPTLYLKMPEQDISVRITHDHKKVLGFNMLGSRWNHEILERWIHERREPQFVLDHLSEAQYDVEFGRISLQNMDISEIPLAHPS